MPQYNLTQVIGTGNETSMLTFVQGVDSVLMNGLLGVLFLGGFFIVLITSFYFNSRDFPASALAASFISFIIGLSMTAIGILSEFFLIITAVATLISAITVWSSG